MPIVGHTGRPHHADPPDYPPNSPVPRDRRLTRRVGVVWAAAPVYRWRCRPTLRPDRPVTCMEAQRMNAAVMTQARTPQEEAMASTDATQAVRQAIEDVYVRYLDA
ncbi:MAG: hypothetical protein ACRDI2_18175, partial [Chloroflexota bacterium]